MGKRPFMLIDFDGGEGSAYYIIAKAIITLNKAGKGKYAEHLANDLQSAHSYDGVLRRVSKYVQIVPNTPVGAEIKRLLEQFENQ
ncbi:MAG: hypothetical protein IJ371_00430 [Clostridia bacterium]|nr:hypothetical protein [Clostridia bacterium]